MKFKTSVPRSIARVVVQTASADSAALVDAADQPAELGDFAHSRQAGVATSFSGQVPQWLQKIVERFPLEQLHQCLSTPPSVPRGEGPGEKVGQSVLAQESLNRAIGELERELELRAGLIREQWAIRGPGLLAALTRQKGFQPPLQEIEVELVLPLTGGAAELDDSGKAWMEALLHDVSFQFPETLRVGWLVARLGSASIDTAVTLLLNAAAEVDWLSPDPATEAELRRWLGVSSVKSTTEVSSSAASRSGSE